MRDFENYYLDNIEHIFAFSNIVKWMQILNIRNIIEINEEDCKLW